MKALDGVLVVSVEQAVAAPYASSRLADAGARVIKVERPEGDFAREYDHFVHGESAYFVWLNRGKESVALNLKEDRDRALLRAMISRADIFIQNLGPSAMDRLGFAADDLRRADPRLITCTISGYGESGPLRHLKAYDLLVQAETGLSEVTGNEAGRARVGVSVCDISAGMTAFQAILQALFARERSGVGAHISVSLYHALADWMNVPYLQFAYGGHVPGRAGLSHPTIAPYGAFTCKDDRAILLSIQNEREWEMFCRDVLDRPEMLTDARYAGNSLRVRNREALDSTISAIFATMTREKVVAKLEAARIAYGRISTLDDLAAHPQNNFVTVATPSGPVTMIAPGALFDRAAPELGAVPGLGEHSDALRQEFEDNARPAS